MPSLLPRPSRSRTVIMVVAAVTVAAAAACSNDEGTATPPAATAGSTTTRPPTTAPATVAPTTAAPTTGAPTTVSPTGPPSTVGTAVRSVAFGELVLDADSCGATFSAPPAGGYPLRAGEARNGSPGDAGFYAVSIRPDPAFGDLTGDGQEDALVVVDCSPGTTPISFAWVYGPGTGAGGVRRLGGLTLDTATRQRLDSFGDPRLTGVAVEGSTAVTTWGTHQPGDPICCPTGQATVTFTWSGSTFVPAA